MKFGEMKNLRTKDLWFWMPLGWSFRTMYARITATRLTAILFGTAVIYALAQVALQSVGLVHDFRHYQFMNEALKDANQPDRIGIVDGQSNLWLCDAVPDGGNPNACFDLKPGVNATVSIDVGQNHLRRDLKVKEIINGTDASGQTTEMVSVTGLPQGDVLLSMECVQSLAWPRMILRQAKREDFTIIGFQLWMMILTFVGIFNESPPHLIAAVVSHGLNTGWSAFEISRTHKLDVDFNRIITNGTCGGIDVLPNFFKFRLFYKIPVLAVSGLGLVVVLYLSWRLLKIYGYLAFKRVGASWRLNRLYKNVLLLTVALQLTAFFLISSTALWIDELCEGLIHESAKHVELYRLAFAITMAVSLPWLVLGWFSVRREKKHLLLLFLALSVAMLAIWATMFVSALYRWTFNIWPFFATLTVVSYVLLATTFCLAVWCRFNFGQGLSQYLQAAEDGDEDIGTFVTVAGAEKGGDNLTAAPNRRKSKAANADSSFLPVLAPLPPATTRPSKVRFTLETKRGRRNFSFSPSPGELNEVLQPPSNPPSLDSNNEPGMTDEDGAEMREQSKFSVTPDDGGPPSWLRSAKGISMISRGLRPGISLKGRKPTGLPANPRASSAIAL